MKTFILTAISFALVFTSSFAQNGSEWKRKISPSLLELSGDGQVVPFLVMMTAQADLSGARGLRTKEAKTNFVFHQVQQTAHNSQGPIKAFLDQHEIPYQSLYIVNAIRTEGSMLLIEALAKRTDVARVMAESTMQSATPVEWVASQGGSRSAIEWGIEMINANDVWGLGYTGQGITVGGQDSGYEWAHPALKRKYRGYDAVLDTFDHNYNWHDAIHVPDPNHPDTINPCGYDSPEPCDDTGHGTHTMGTMIGSDGDFQIGVAPDSKWCGCRNMERNYGTPFTYIECFQWFLAPTDLNNENPDPTKAPHVINNSWGCPPIEGCDTSNFEIMNMVVNTLRAAGIVVVASAGNSGSGCSTINTPAPIYEGSFAVGATAVNDTIAGFSSRGPVTVDGSNRLKPNVSAPGVWVQSSTVGGGYGHASGTSMAGPHVAGLVALMISANPALAGQVDLIEDIIEQTAVPKTTDQQCGDIPGSEVPNHTYGFGRVDALAAVEAALDLIETSIQDENTSSAIKSYPNPVDHQLFIETQQLSGQVNIALYDLQGRLMLQQRWETEGALIQRIDVSELPSGFYVYKISCGGEVFHGKVLRSTE